MIIYQSFTYYIKKLFKLLAQVALIFFVIPINFVKAQNEDLQSFSTAAVNSYIYAYPLVLMDLTKQVMTNVPSAQNNGRAPINQFSHAAQLRTPDNKDMVRPNCDTLYSYAWLDLSKEPLILSVPDTNDRYYLLPFLDAWTEVVYSLGKRTTGTKAKNFLIIGPNWAGKIPKNAHILKMPTNLVWIIGRTLTNGIDDYENVHAIQKGYKLTPLSSWGKEYIPPTHLPVDPNIDMKTIPYEQVGRMDTEKFFIAFTKALKNNPPHAVDSKILNDLKKIKIVPGELFDISQYTKAEIRELDRAIQGGQYIIKASALKERSIENGWIFTENTGSYNTNYLDRAVVAYYGLGANLPEDSIYPTAYTDGEISRLNGANHYILHFTRQEVPPVKGFWSVTLYAKDGYLVPNLLNRYSLGDRSNLKFNKDGSLDIYVQYDNPGIDKESNWLPAPIDDFNLTMRLYWPKERLLKGFWKPPKVKRQ